MVDSLHWVSILLHYEVKWEAALGGILSQRRVLMAEDVLNNRNHRHIVA
jgi:hypothetical protein